MHYSASVIKLVHMIILPNYYMNLICKRLQGGLQKYFYTDKLTI